MWHHLRQPSVRVHIVTAGVLLSKALSFGHTSTFIYSSAERNPTTECKLDHSHHHLHQVPLQPPGRAEVKEETSPLSEGSWVEREEPEEPEEPEDACRQETTSWFTFIMCGSIGPARLNTEEQKPDRTLKSESVNDQLIKSNQSANILLIENSQDILK